MAKHKRRNTPRDVPKGSTTLAALATLLAQAVHAHEAGDLDRAERCYRKYLRRNADHGEAWYQLGGLLFQLEKIPLAIDALETAMRLLPGESDPACDLGGLYLSVGRFDAAEWAFHQALAISPESTAAQYNLGIALYSRGKIPQSIACLSDLVQAQPDFAEAHFNLGVAFRTEGKLAQAIVALEKARTLQPDNTAAMLELARAYSEARSLERATTHYLDYLTFHTDTAVVAECATVLHDNGETERGLALLDQRISASPNDDTLYVCLARIRHNTGDLAGAEQALRDGLRVNPNSISAMIGLSRIRRITAPDDAVLDLLRRKLATLGDDDPQIAALHFSIAKIYDDLSLYDDAFEHYSRANEIQGKRSQYDSAKTEDTFSRIIEFFDQKRIDGLGKIGSASDIPVLIVGMPRSGTTLVEQVISSHPRATGAGELQYFPSLSAQLPEILDSQLPFPDCLAEMRRGSAATITTKYLELLHRHSRDALKITDKLPGNYLYVGLFKALFPNGRVISCRRDPVDVALSIYFQDFAQGHDYAWDLDDIARQYGQYERVMQHWLQLLPRSILEVCYEETVNDFEAVARRLITFCDLPWDDNCLEFHHTERDVRTASNWQVRQPIYRRSLSRWKHYQQHIAPLIQALRPA